MKKSNKSHKDLSIPTGRSMQETCHLSVNLHHRYQLLAVDESSYIHEHLSTLYFIVKEFGCKNVLDIGTGPGHSAATMAEAGAVVTTLDIEQCNHARDLITFEYFLPNVNFIKIDKKIDLEGHWDLVMIDGGHTEEQVTKDINQFAWQVNEGGFLIFHDTTNPAWGGVAIAVNKWYAQHQDEYDRYDWFNCNGLAIFRRRKFES